MRAVFLAATLVLTTVGAASARAAEASAEALERVRAVVDEGRALEAIRIVEELHEQGEANAESHYLLGLAYQVRLDEVGLLSKRAVAGRLRATLEQALRIDPEHVGAHEELADFFHYAPAIVGGSERRAAAQIERLASFSPYDAHRVRGRHAYDAGEYRQADQHLSRALALDDSSATVWFLRANARMKRREVDAAALADYERALELGYDEPVAYYQVGRLCARLASCAERGEEVLRHFIAHSEGRDQAIGRYRLAQLFEQNGRLTEARDEAREALRLEPDIRDIQALLERVEKKLGPS